MDEKGWWAAVSTTIASGLGLFNIGKIIQERRDKQKAEQKVVDDRVIEDNASLRQELWGRMRELESRITTLETEVEVWRTKYFGLQDKYQELLGEHKTVLREAADLRVYVEKLKSLAKLKNLDSFIELQRLLGEMEGQMEAQHQQSTLPPASD